MRDSYSTICQIRKGALGLLLLTGAPILMAASGDGIKVESRDIEPQSVKSESYKAQDSKAQDSKAQDSKAQDSESTGFLAQGLGSRNIEPRSMSDVQELPFQAPLENGTVSSGIEAEYQAQLMEQEVQTLRGLVEDLQYQLKRMKKIQDDRYLELDSRFQELREQRVTRTLAAGELDSTKQSATTSAGATAPATTVQGEKSLYDTALELIRNRQYDLAITQLEGVINRFPNGEYAPNAYYWLGEVYAAMPVPDYESARQAFVQVMTLFPDHRKVPDAAFKLGKVHHLMGDCSKAKALLSDVVEQHQGKSVAKLASSYMRDSMSDCNS